MKIENIKTSDLIPYARNAKKHDASQVAKLAGSIREFGFNNPVLIDKDNGIIAGHGRVLAAPQRHAAPSLHPRRQPPRRDRRRVG
jgi:ParB-like chromosome segregation protein Spo0J